MLQMGGNVGNTHAVEPANTEMMSPCRLWLTERCVGAGLLAQVRHEAFFSPLRFPLEPFGKNETGRKHPRIHIVVQLHVMHIINVWYKLSRN